jgi:hypothetical protein
MNPKKPTEEKARGIGVSLIPEVHAASKAIAKERKISFSALVQELLIKAIEEAGKNLEESGKADLEKAAKLKEGNNKRHAQ